MSKRNTIYMIILIVVIVGLYILLDSESRYSSSSSIYSNGKVAIWSVEINEKDIQKEETFNLKLSPTSNTPNNKILPDSEGYFEIAINPKGTQVGLEYEILFDLSKINSENREIKLTSYSLDGGITKTEMPSDNKITGEINLKENSTGLTEEDTTTVKVYWSWQQDITNPTFENPNIQVTSIVKQKITDGSENV